MGHQPTMRASTLAAEICMTMMRDPNVEATIRDSAAAVALWLQSGPHDHVARVTANTVHRLMEIDHG
jgi:hypothetical protein